MKLTNLFLTGFLCLFLTLSAQKKSQCVHCTMFIKDTYHNAEATKKDNSILKFDAIECLINYLKVHNDNTFKILKVSDFKTGQLIDAKTARYLVSKSISSPMGANLSAFKNKETAKELKKEKDGEIYTWDRIKLKFQNSKFGATNHNHHDHYRPDAHAPIGIMGDHLHEKGGLMLSFRYMTMVMEDNKSGTSKVSNEDIYNNYMVAPQNMTMNMYMLGIMYAPSSKLTFMLMQNYLKKNMDATAQMNMNGMPMLYDFTTNASGVGDLKLAIMHGIFNNHKSALHINAKLNIPVGNIQNRDNTPMMDNAKLPYAMQLGSGTFDISLGATYKQNYTNTSWGSQLSSTIRTGKNSEGYRHGNTHQLNIWGAYKISTNFSLSGRLLGTSEGDIQGKDAELNPIMVTTANTINYGGEKIKTFLGLNISFPETSSLKDFRLGFEAGAPIFEDYNGIQMNENLNLNIGLKYNIHK